MTERRARRSPLFESVGNTPLIELSFFDGIPGGTRLFAKLETANPNGSLKDRPVARMMSGAIDAGRLDGGRRLLDSTSGNAGIAYAAFGAALGVGVTLVVPGNASRERIDRIRAHGAEVIETDPMEGYDFAIREARRLADLEPGRYWYCNQYDNPDNWQAHYEGTGQEILEELGARSLDPPQAFVCGIGTGGSITGVGRRLRRVNPDMKIIAVVPEPFPGIEGLKPLGQPGDLVPGILDPSLLGNQMVVKIEEALAWCDRLAREGIFVGPSSGAYVHAAVTAAATKQYSLIVTILCDTGERYFSTGMWSDQSISARVPTGKRHLKPDS